MDEIVVSPELAARFEEAIEQSHAVFFSAPCGYGKTAVARALLPGRRTVFADARAENFRLPDPGGDWEVLLLDELQCLRSERSRRALCAMLQRGGERRFVLLSRGPVPAWLISFQAAGTLRVFDRAALTLDRDAALRLLRSRGAEPTAEDMNAIFRRTGGYPLALCCAALPCWRRAAAITARPAVPAARWRRWLALSLPQSAPGEVAAALQRMGQPWKERFEAALVDAERFGLRRAVSALGAAVQPMFGNRRGAAADAVREQTAVYPAFLCTPAAPAAAPLTAAEKQVLRLLAENRTNAEICAALGVSLPTVKTHVSHILKKLGVNRRSEAGSAAARLRLLDGG